MAIPKQGGGTPTPSFYRNRIVTSKLDLYLQEKNRIISDLLERCKLSDKKILDVGCGCGELLANIRGRNLIGVDLSSKEVSSAAETVKNAFFVVCDAGNLPFRKDCFDVAICSEVLEHMSSPEKVLTQINCILKKHGVFIATVPNLVELYGWFLLLLNLFLGLKDKSYRIYVTDYWRTTISVNGIRSSWLGHLHVKPPTSWRKMIVKSGFKVEGSFGIMLLPLRNSVYEIVNKQAKLKILRKEDTIRYRFPINCMSNGIGFIAEKS